MDNAILSTIFSFFENYRQPADKYLAQSAAEDIQLMSVTHELKFEAYDGKMRQSPIDDTAICYAMRSPTASTTAKSF